MGGNKESKGMPGKDWKTESAAVELLFGWFDGWLVVARGLLLLVYVIANGLAAVSTIYIHGSAVLSEGRAFFLHSSYDE